MLAYLGAYTHRIAISNPRILGLENQRVTFRYRDSADREKQKILRLDVSEFIRRFLLHVLPKGFVRIRHYGLLANRTRKKKIARCRELLSAPAPAPQPQPLVKEPVAEKLLRLTGVDLHCCPACHQGRMVVVAQVDRPPRISLPPRRVEINDSS